MIINDLRHRWNIYLVLLLYKITLDLIYVLIIVPRYSYTGYLVNFSVYKYVISLVVLAIMFQPIAGLIIKISPSSLIILILNLAYFIPGCTLYAFYGFSNAFFCFYAVYWSLLMFFHYYFKRFHVLYPPKKITPFLFYAVVFIIAATGLFISGAYNGFRFHFGLMDVYDLRDIQSKLDLPVIVRYLQPLASVFLPIALVYFLIKKEILWAILLATVQLLLFAFGGHKTTLFALFIAVLIYLFYTEKRAIWILYFVLILNIIVFIESLFLNGISYTSSFVQYRTFFMPNMISAHFFDFFSSHEFVYLRDSFLRWFGFKNPYDMPIPLLISGVYSGNYQIWANNGLCGDAFYQFGWLSLLIYPVLITFVIRVFEACTKNLDIRIVFTSCILFSQAFINNSFFIVMLTNGFMFTCFFLYLMPRKALYSDILPGRQTFIFY
jgi:hypothetical protein